MIPVSAGASFLESLWIEDFKWCSTFLCNCPKERHRGAENNEHKLHKLMNRELGSETESTGWAAAPLQSPCKSSSSAALLSPCWDGFFFTHRFLCFPWRISHPSDFFPLCCTVIPVFLHPPQDLVAETGQDVAISCAAQGDPRPTITWVKVRGDDFMSLGKGTAPLGEN